MSKKQILAFIFAGGLLYPIIGCGSQEQNIQERHASYITQKILSTRRALMSGEAKGVCTRDRDCLFLVFWDFDGTILKGDCTEGYHPAGLTGYPGLLRAAIERGFSARYRGKTGYDELMKEYRIARSRDPREAYRMVISVFAGAEHQDLLRLSQEVFSSELNKHFFASSHQMIRFLEDNGIKNYVISASPDFFVKGAAASLKLPVDRFFGITPELQGGRITDKIDEPFPYGAGKTGLLKRIAESARRQAGAKRVFVIGGFGNDYSTDGDFLSYIEDQKFPVGKALSVMINGGSPPAAMKNRFLLVTQRQRVPAGSR